jgi:photosystem II stability/assembly factor-like uncharacterized protein
MKSFSAILGISLLGLTQVLGQNPVNTTELYQTFLSLNPGSKSKKLADRWLYFTENRSTPEGNLPDADIHFTEWLKYRAEHSQKFQAASTPNWSQWGPNPSFRVGRTQCLRQDPSNPNVLYLGTPASGLYKSTNGGGSWTGLTDFIPVLGVSDVAIDPSNPQIVYMACGDADGGTLNNVYSVGVMKSTDGGTTWSTTGLNWNFSNARRIGRLIINPDSTNVLLAATSNGIYRTRNGGTTWTQVRTGNHEDIEFHSVNSGIVYAGSSSQFLRSIDGGFTWTASTTGLPATGNRVIVAVSPINPSAVWCVFASNTAFTGLYKSSDQGLTFSTLGSSGVSSAVGGFPWYALTLAVSPKDENLIAIGGILARRTADNGATWSSTGTENDYHDMVFWQNSKDSLFICNDKGVYRMNNLSAPSSTLTNLNSNLNLIMCYRIGITAANSNIGFCGTQDNATYKLNTGVPDFSGVMFNSDGGYCEVDQTTGNFVLAEREYGQLFKSTTGGGPFSYSACSPPAMSGQGYFVTPMRIHSQNQQIVYAGYDEVWKSTDGATTWTTVSNFPGSTDLRHLTVAPSDGEVVYVSTGSNLWKTTNGGSSWADLSAMLPFTSNITSISVHSTDANKVWLTRGGFTAGGKVYYSNDGGLTWSNISGTLANVPANCLAHENNPVDGLYVGTDLGVWYRDNSMSDWVPYNTGLPVVVINQLEIQYATNKIIAGTYGRGFWISYLNAFTVGQTTIENHSGLSVFPNPANGVVQINIPEEFGQGKLSLYDLKGRIIFERNLSNTIIHNLNVSKYESGIYLLEVFSNGKVFRERVVVGR